MLIAVTGFSDHSDRQAALDAGFDRFLVKPLRMESLISMLGELSPVLASSR